MTIKWLARKRTVAAALVGAGILAVPAVIFVPELIRDAPESVDDGEELICVQGECHEKDEQSGAAEPAATQPIEAGDREAVFSDVSAVAGVRFVAGEFPGEPLPFGGGAVVFDFDSDGLQDIYAVNASGPNALYRNNGDGTFAEVAAAAGVADADGRGHGACAADYDNDGYQDLYLTNFGINRLFRNNGDGTFSDVTAETDVEATFAKRWMGCAWGDYDSDGFVDLVVVHHLIEYDARKFSIWEPLEKTGGVLLLHNRGDGTFANTTRLLGDDSQPATVEIERTDFFGNVWGAGFQPVWVDLDNDGDLDLYVVNDFGGKIQPNVLWRNDGPADNGGWSFVDISSASGGDIQVNGMGLAVGDYDLDGFLDLFMTNIGDSVLLRNKGGGLSFTDTAATARVTVGSVGPDDHRATWGAVFFDYDNDGDEDLYVVSGHMLDAGPSDVAVEQPNVLLENNRDGTFADVSPGSGANDSGFGRGGVYLDYDGDGCLDLFVTNYGQAARLLRNVCETGNSWLTVRPVGTASNRDGIGARVTVEANGETQMREISAGSSQMGQNMLVAHFGLGSASRVDSVTVRWPSGKVLSLTDVPANEPLVVTEPQ